MESETDLGASRSARDLESPQGAVSLFTVFTSKKKKAGSRFLIPVPTPHPLILLLSVTEGEQGDFGQRNGGLKSQFCLELAVWPKKSDLNDLTVLGYKVIPSSTSLSRGDPACTST